MHIPKNLAPPPIQEPSPWYRWLILICVSSTLFGIGFIDDYLRPIADLFKTQQNFTDPNIGWLAEICRLSNLVMVLMSGVMLDLLGARRASVLFSCICLIGVVVAGFQEQFRLLTAGRMIFRLGACALFVATATIIAWWFKGKELSLAFGLNFTSARLGSFTALNFPALAPAGFANWQKSRLFMLIASIILVIAMVSYFSLETQSLKRYTLILGETVDRVKFKMRIAAFSNLSRAFWLLTGLSVIFYAARFPFRSLTFQFFGQPPDQIPTLAGFTSGFMLWAMLIGPPLVGLVIDFTGRRLSLLCFSAMCILAGYLLLPDTTIPPMLPILLLGTAFSLLPVIIWPSVAFLVEKTYLGTAYGLMTVVQNIGLMGLRAGIGPVHDPRAAVTVRWLFLILGGCACFFTLLLKRCDRRSLEGRLEYSTIRTEK